MKTEYKNKVSRWLCSALIMCCMVILTTPSFERSLAAMRSQSTGNDSIEVAAFAVSAAPVAGDDLALNCNTGMTSGTYEFAVSNSKNGTVSDVDIIYSIEITFSAPLEEGILLQLDGLSGTASLDRKTYTFENKGVWVLSKGTAQSSSHSLTFTVDPNAVTHNIDIANVMVKVVAEQAD